MKKSILFTALVALLIATSCAGSDTTSEETATPAKKKAPERQNWDNEIPLYGDVESVTVYGYDIVEKSGETVKVDDDGQKEVYKFNERGDVDEFYVYEKDGSLGFKYLYKYDSQGNEIERSSGSLSSKTIYKYDSQGNKIEATGYDSDGSLSGYKELYEYDSQGNMIKKESYGSGWRSQYTYKYDARGNMIEEAKYDSDCSLESKKCYKYDLQGNMIEEARYRSDGSLRMVSTFKRNSQGQFVEAVVYGPNSSILGKSIPKLDSQGNMIEVFHYEGENTKPTSVTVREIVYRK